MNTSEKVAELSRWIDESYGNRMPAELRFRRRVGKIAEEFGEAMEALGGWSGENPRKGFTHSKQDVMNELMDVIVSAAGAWESINGNPGVVFEDALETHMDFLLKRVGLDVR